MVWNSNVVRKWVRFELVCRHESEKKQAGGSHERHDDRRHNLVAESLNLVANGYPTRLTLSEPPHEPDCRRSRASRHQHNQTHLPN